MFRNIISISFHINMVRNIIFLKECSRFIPREITMVRNVNSISFHIKFGG